MQSLYERIIEVLQNAKVGYKEFRHKPVRTSEEAAKVRGNKLSEGAKALIFMADDKPIQLIIQGHLKVDKDKFKREYNVNKLKMASPEEVLLISSAEPGGVPPFGSLFEPSIPVYVDENLLKLEEIEFNAGDKSISIRMRCEDWQNIVNPIVSSFAKD